MREGPARPLRVAVEDAVELTSDTMIELNDKLQRLVQADLNQRLSFAQGSQGPGRAPFQPNSEGRVQDPQCSVWMNVALKISQRNNLY